jgi:hypothetical protein
VEVPRAKSPVLEVESDDDNGVELDDDDEYDDDAVDNDDIF